MLFWLVAISVYLVFLGWYYNWSGPIKPHEIDALVAQLSESSGASHTDINVVRQFLEEDDGKAFVMQNFVRFHSGDIKHPLTGELSSPRSVLMNYVRPFAMSLFKGGGHPVNQARICGGLIDSWGDAQAPAWQGTGMMRYRSRRQLIELASDPRFSDIHVFKLAAIESTQNYPVTLVMSVYLSPGVYVPLCLALLASLAQNIFA